VHSGLDHLSIRARVLLVLSLPATGLLVWLLTSYWQQARDGAHAKVSILAADAAANVERFRRDYEATMSRLAARPLVKALDPNQCDPVLGEYVDLNPELTTFAVRDLQGRVVCAYRWSAKQRLMEGNAPWFSQALRSGKFFVSSPVMGSQTGRWVSVFVHPIRDDAGALIGLLTLPVDLARVSAQLLVATPASAVVTVIDRDRVVVLRLADTAAFTGKAPDTGLPDPGSGRSDGIFSGTGRDGVQRLIAVQPIPGLGWQVVAGFSQAGEFARYNTQLKQASGLSVGILLLALALAWRVGSGIVRPVSLLSVAAVAVGAGDLAARAAVSGPAEVENVARQFNRMLDARDASELALRECEERFRSLVDLSPDSISVHRDRKLVYANPATVKLFGATSANDLVGRSSIDFVHPDYRRIAQENAQYAIGHGGVTPVVEQKVFRLDGTLVDAEVQAVLISYGGQPALLASMHDITASKHAACALHTSEARLRGIVESSTDAILTADETQTVVAANPAAAKMFGYRVDELVGAPLARLIPARYRERHQSDVKAFGASAGSARHMGRIPDARGLRAGGEEFLIDASVSQLAIDGSRLYTVILRDITEQRHAEHALRQTQVDLRRLIAAQDRVQENERKRIARELHDDLQQTLGAIKFNAMAIGEGLLASPQAVPALLGEIDDLGSGAIGSTRRIVNNLRPHMLEDLGLVPAVEALAGQFGQYTGIACRLDADADIDDVLAQRADLATCLYRVTQEAFNNVLKHARAGRVEIRLTHAPDGQVVLRITDDGCGMADPGQRKAGSFGLMGMRERVRAIGGVLRVDSRPGVGATVEVTLPQSVLAGAPADESLEGSYLSAKQPLAEAANSAHTEQDALGATDSGRPPGVVDTIPGTGTCCTPVRRRAEAAW
jgi:PAS domain S-box-containing protein